MYNEQSPNCLSKPPSVAQYDQAIGALEAEQYYTEDVIDQLFDKLERVLAPPQAQLDSACEEATQKWQGQVLDHIDSLKRTRARMSCRLQDILSRLPF